MRALITNDDGLGSRGIKALTDIACRYFDDVWVVSTDKGNSGMSHAITMPFPIFVDPVKEENGLHIYKTTGTPADCVKIAVDYLMEDRIEPDMILSGINHGSNSNASVLYSGTIGAAMEGAFYRIPSLGFSLTDHNPDAPLFAAIHYTDYIVRKVLEMDTEKKRGLCLNVNIPPLPLSEIKGVKVARQNMGCWREDFKRGEDPRGRKYVWMRGQFYSREPEAEDTDDWLLSQGYVTMVPIKVDLTDHQRLQELRKESF